VAGTGVATRAVTAALQVAATRGVRSVIARTSTTNHASQRVLDKCRFTATGPAESPAGSSERAVGYRRNLAATAD
jgi:RimJ/RimL family protein N-acetyltransferase